MGYSTDVIISIPTAIIIYLLVEKLIISMTSENKFSERVQKSFVMGFVIGLGMIALGMTLFAPSSNMNNQPLRYAMYLSGGFLVLNSVFFNWDDLDEGTKIVILAVSMLGIIIYTYHH